MVSDNLLAKMTHSVKAKRNDIHEKHVLDNSNPIIVARNKAKDNTQYPLINAKDLPPFFNVPQPATPTPIITPTPTITTDDPIIGENNTKTPNKIDLTIDNSQDNNNNEEVNTVPININIIDIGINGNDTNHITNNSNKNNSTNNDNNINIENIHNINNNNINNIKPVGTSDTPTTTPTINTPVTPDNNNRQCTPLILRNPYITPTPVQTQPDESGSDSDEDLVELQNQLDRNRRIASV